MFVFCIWFNEVVRWSDRVVREGNALQGVSRWFRRIQRILRFHIDKYQPLRERERDLFQNRKRKRLSHMIANVKFHVTRCHPVTLYKSVTLPPVDQIIIWLPNSIWSTNPCILLRQPNSTIIRSKVQSSLSQILQPGLPSSVSLNCSCSSWAASCRHWLLSSHFSANWIRILAWDYFGCLLDRNFALDL